jgi:CelD/BcsL family acetyltransferase involved in cellulose biosynthesis
MASKVQQAPVGVAFADPRGIDSQWHASWDDLALHAAEPNSFMERWFLGATLANLSLPRSLRIAFVWGADGQLEGVLPLHIESRYGRFPVRNVQNWLHYNCFLGAPLVRKGREQRFWCALLEALDRTSWAEGLIHFTGLVADGPIHSGLVEAAAALGRPCDTVFRTDRALLESSLSPSAYYETTVRKKKRKEIGRLKSRLAELGGVTMTALGNDDESSLWCDDFLTLERSGWKGESGSALGSTPATEAFFRSLIADGVKAGRIEILKLCLDEKPIAMLVNFIALPGSFSFKIAYDEDYARYSPGVLIQLENLAILERPGFAWMDSCAIQNHPMINSLWGERRQLAWVALPLGGVKHGMIFRCCRMAENGWAAIKKLRGSSPANDNRTDDND